MKIYKIVLLVITFIYSSSFIFSQDYYVSDNLGSDSNSGTLSSPFKTINKGISMVNAGGTVYVMDGIYKNEDYGTVDILSLIHISEPTRPY